VLAFPGLLVEARRELPVALELPLRWLGWHALVEEEDCFLLQREGLHLLEAAMIRQLAQEESLDEHLQGQQVLGEGVTLELYGHDQEPLVGSPAAQSGP
jgi:hypothetical protein